MSSRIHGTKDVPERSHPVLDIRHWETQFPFLEEHRRSHSCSYPRGLALREQAIQEVKGKGDLGPSVASDVFVWALTDLPKQPWLTRIGGDPWRPAGKPWPRDKGGIPLVFLGQICFADSADLLPFKLPGEVALIFGRFWRGAVSLSEGSALEWSPLKLEDPFPRFGGPWTGYLPFEYQGVIHRTTQYSNWETADPVFKAAGFTRGSSGIASVQASSISTYADLPQGWPFEDGDGHSLVATLDSFYFHFAPQWPLCDVPAGVMRVNSIGQETIQSSSSGDFGVGDAGCMYIYRDSDGQFHLADAGH